MPQKKLEHKMKREEVYNYCPDVVFTNLFFVGQTAFIESFPSAVFPYMACVKGCGLSCDHAFHRCDVEAFRAFWWGQNIGRSRRPVIDVTSSSLLPPLPFLST